jgi:hypothetical protein
VAPVRSVRAVGTATVGTHWHPDNRPDFSGIAVWLDAVAEFEVQDPARADDEEAGDDAHAEPVPWLADVGSPEYAHVWRPLAGSGREPRPGLVVSVVGAGEVTAYPTPLADPPVGAVARAMARLKRPEPEPRRPDVLAADVEPAPPPPRRPAAPRRDYGEVRALVGMMIEVLVGRRTATHAAHWTTPEVRGKLRLPRFARDATLKSVRLSDGGRGIEALALVRDGGRTRAVALRFDQTDNAKWQCTALQTG